MGHVTRRHLLAATAATAAIGTVGTRSARALQAPADRPILTISGKIGDSNSDGSAQFDRTMLEKIGMVTVETTTPWYSGPMKFEGVRLKDLMSAVKADGDKIVAIALNDYSSEIPFEDITKYNVILALKRNGDYMPVKDKGPLFVIYPYDSDPTLKTQTYYGRSVWQIAKLVVK